MRLPSAVFNISKVFTRVAIYSSLCLLAPGLVQADFEQLIVDPVNARTIRDQKNELGDVLTGYIDQSVVPNAFYAAKWTYNNAAWDPALYIVNASDVNLGSGSFNIALSPNGAYQAAAWTNSPSLKTIASLNSGGGFSLLPTITHISDPITINVLNPAVNNDGYVAVFSGQRNTGGATSGIYATIWNGSVWNQFALGNYSWANVSFFQTQAQVDDSGNFYFAWTAYDVPTKTVTLYAAIYDSSTETMGPTENLLSVTEPTSNSASVYSAISSQGAFAVRLIIDLGATSKWIGITYKDGVWGDPANLTPGPILPSDSNNGGGTNQFGVNDQGVAQFAFSLLDAGVYTIYSVVSEGSTVTIAPVTSTTSHVISTRGDIDNFGNGVITWKESIPSDVYSATQEQQINLAIRNGQNGAWQPPITIVSNLTANQIFSIVGVPVNINSSGAVISKFNASPGNGTTSNSNFSSFNIAVGLNLFNPQPVENFAGREVKNKFATQTDIINVLEWVASPDPTVVSYNLYRNGTLIANVPVTTLRYDDHNRRKGVTYTYVIRTVNGAGLESGDQVFTIIDK